MKRQFFIGLSIALTCALAAGYQAYGCGGYGSPTTIHAYQAVAEDETRARPAIKALREAGPEGLAEFLEVHRAALEQPLAKNAGPAGKVSPDLYLQRVLHALDQISGQRDCRGSRLYWYTDLDKAKAAAAEQNKPILSLRMMGKLTDEYSCANSRFFRSTLYANAKVSKLLREKFVLHWESVRPVPKVSIDFGDGRKLERTLTGNSIHYVLDNDGRVIDALPGLYSSKAFLAILSDAAAVYENSRQVTEERRVEFFSRYHRDRMTQIESAWASDLRQLGIELPAVGSAVTTAPKRSALAREVAVNGPPRAEAAAQLAIGKRQVEMPILARTMPSPPAISADDLKNSTSEDLWPKIAALHFDDAELDQASRALIASKNPTAAEAGRLAYSKMVVEDPLVRIFRNLQNSIALDTVRNEYLFRWQILQWLASDQPQLAADVWTLNERVYAELFLTPRNDPWLGLLPSGTYSALDNNGVVLQASN